MGAQLLAIVTQVFLSLFTAILTSIFSERFVKKLIIKALKSIVKHTKTRVDNRFVHDLELAFFPELELEKQRAKKLADKPDSQEP